MNYRRMAVVVLVAVAVLGCGKSSKTSAGSGQAGDATKATRTTDIHITTAHRYDPSSVAVSPGETVTFNVINDDTALHEFVIGDDKVQNDYEKLMAGMGTTPMKMADKPNVVDVDPGQSKKLTWTFPTKKGTTVIYGSHQPGDYAGGLKGTVTVG